MRFSRDARFGQLSNASARAKRALRVAAGAAAACVLFVAEAKADTQSCVTSHASGQREVKAGRLKLATELFTSCGSDSSCPEQIRAECAELLDKARAATPTVILSVLDEQGGDISAVKVYSTDELIVDSLDGRAISLDPGKHRLRFLLPWGDVLSSDVLIREGEKNRMIQVRVEPKVKEPPPAPAAPAEAPPPPPPPPPKTPVAAWVMTGVAVAGASVFGTFAVLGSSKKAELDECAPRCSRAKEGTRDDLKRSYLIADIGLGTAVLSSALAIYFFASNGPSDAPTATAVRRPFNLTAGLAAGPQSAGLLLSGQFR